MDRKQKEKVSIIIPVYRVEEYLKTCVDSVTEQTYEDLEIILVDDGSDDKCPVICDEYARNDDRVKVIHQENGGQGNARNNALDLSEGEYIVFLDADDYIEKDYVERLLSVIHETDCDIVICNYRHVDESGRVIKGGPRSRIKRKSYTGEEAMRVALYWREFGVSPWAKMFRRSVWEKIRFKEDRIYEDLGTTYRVYYNAKKVVFINEIKLNYRIRQGSDVHQPFKIEKASVLRSSEEILAFCRSESPSSVRAAKSRELASACFVLLRMPDEDLERYKDAAEKCKEIIRRNRAGVIMDHKARFKTRAGAFLSLFGFNNERWLFSHVEGTR